MVPEISIITVNKNNAIGLKRTIQSVINQDFEPIDYIVIDGNSDDTSVDVIERFQESISYWVSESDSGVFEAMNKGVKMAKGEYCLFLNSGDWLINNQVISNIFAVNRKADILYGKCNISKNGQIVHVTNPPETITFGALYLGGLAHQTTLIKRRLFSQFGYYREDFKYHADIEFWYRSIILNSASTEKLDFVISDYNLHGISTNEKDNSDFKKEHSIILSHPIFKKLVPDYEELRALRVQNAKLNLINKYSIASSLTELIYRVSKKINSFKKK